MCTIEYKICCQTMFLDVEREYGFEECYEMREISGKHG